MKFKIVNFREVILMGKHRLIFSLFTYEKQSSPFQFRRHVFGLNQGVVDVSNIGVFENIAEMKKFFEKN